MFHPNPRAVRATALALLFLLCLGYLYLPTREVIQQHIPTANSSSTNPPPKETDAPVAALPADYSYEEPQSAYCRDRFSTKYLTDLRDTSFQYCDPASSASRLNCFHSHAAEHGQADSLCVATGAMLDEEHKRFAVGCSVSEPDDQARSKGVVSFSAIRSYWYDTGARHLLDHFVHLHPSAGSSAAQSDSDERRFTLLIKREGEGNPWHCLMEIWSMAMTMDVLHMAADPDDASGGQQRPFFRVPEDLANTQVVILDDRADGPYFDLWTLFSGRAPIRLHQIRGNPEATAFFNGSAAAQHLILPLAGATNPTWQNDWQARDCTRAPTLDVFSRRVLAHYRVPDDDLEAGPDDNTVRLTFVDRKDAHTRMLRNQDQLLAAVQAAFPDVVVQAVDFGSLAFSEQLRVARQTDILVGMHGAGLTHTMFLRKHLTAVVEIQPADMDGMYMGFRNMANMLGIGYFRAHAQPEAKQPEKEPDLAEDAAEGPSRRLARRASWHQENFAMETDVFVGVVGAAVRSLYSKGQRNHDAM